MNPDIIIAFGAGMLVWMAVEWLVRWYDERHPHDKR